ncbi:hypothetical protein [Knoellia aerolata]|uniref:Uncharacterized protein n=1 Tax=Knoellia aerolata DSM 18566 TaxID=1385519 RepID=A0A0A0JUM0_9MICO|nr:hypothetical protein [Knoellia aerolata]KGN41050.1 hypothetical protein N801_09770 [Knoellia aerolata DSM 18566]
MTAYPHRYGDTDRAVERYATACVASATILRNQGLPHQAVDLEEAAERARAQSDRLDQPGQPGRAVDRSIFDRDDLDRDDPDLFDPDLVDHDLFDDDGQVPRWGR